MAEPTGRIDRTSAAAREGATATGSASVATVLQLTTDQVWRVLDKTSNAVLGHVTPTGAPRTSGVVYAVVDRHLYIAVAPDSWKARQIATGDHVSVTALVSRGGVLSLPPDRRDSACLIGVAPEGHFLTYGIGVPLTTMRQPQAARARVPVV